MAVKMLDWVFGWYLFIPWIVLVRVFRWIDREYDRRFASMTDEDVPLQIIAGFLYGVCLEIWFFFSAHIIDDDMDEMIRGHTGDW